VAFAYTEKTSLLKYLKI